MLVHYGMILGDVTAMTKYSKIYVVVFYTKSTCYRQNVTENRVRKIYGKRSVPTTNSPLVFSVTSRL